MCYSGIAYIVDYMLVINCSKMEVEVVFVFFSFI